ERRRGFHTLSEIPFMEALALRALGFNQAGFNRVDANFARAKFFRENSCNGIQCGLGPGIDRRIGRIQRADAGADIDDAPASGPVSFTASLVANSTPRTLRLKIL